VFEDMSLIDPTAMLRAGCKILDPVMKRHGFTFVEGQAGQGSGGYFATGNYVRDNRQLELHFRHSLGLVAYHLGSEKASHESYMQELLGSAGGNLYPGFSDDPLDGFRHLAHDLDLFASDFLSGGGEALITAAAKEREEERVRGEISMAHYVGDTRKREDARKLFRECNYRGVVEHLESLSYPELKTESDKKILEISKRKLM
jgi:hypothetical protein